MKTKSAIICAYNEAGTIKDVVSIVSDYFFDEVIVVNDGSTDETDFILQEMKDLHNIKCITLPENKGKGFAMATGIEETASEIIVFIDADLSNLQEDHFAQLITPVINNEADMVLGQATETLINYNLNPFKSFTGERTVLRKDILPLVDKMKESRFGVETLINLYYQSAGKTVKYVMLDKLEHPTKFDKTSPSQAMKEYVKEGHQITLTAFKNFDLITKTVRSRISKHT